MASNSQSFSTSSDSEEEKGSINQRKRVPKRKSAKDASLTEEFNLQKEKEEKQIRIPYHKPKQYNLKEFLSRRTINKPPPNKIKPFLKIKMNNQELQDFSKKMRERELEAIEFFKSESDGEEARLEPLTEAPQINKTECQPLVANTSTCLKTLDELNMKDTVIDLTTGLIQSNKLSGADKLFERYLKSVNKPKHKDSVSMNILSVENGKIEKQRVNVKLDKEVELDHNRPGLSHQQLKEDLRSKIMQMRLAEAKNKFFKTKEGHTESEYESFNTSSENQLDDMEQFNCDEAIDEESGDDDYDCSNDSESTEKDEPLPTNSTIVPWYNGTSGKRRILKACIDSDVEIEVNANLTSSVETVDSLESFNVPSFSEELKTNNLSQLFDSVPPDFSQVNEHDLMALCSGQFSIGKSFVTSDLGKFDTSTNDAKNFDLQIPQKLPKSSEMLNRQFQHFFDSTDDEKDIKVEGETLKTKKLKKRRRKLINKLSFSDDEENDEQLLKDKINIVEKSNDEDVPVEYDSEENEIEVKITKKEQIKMASEYFEKEAELSETDWESADENEKGLDRYEVELADEEQFDQTQLREEIGRIHAKKIMDEDIKKVKRLQDMLFEDEENDGVGRERKFRWKNQGEGFTIDDENARDADNMGNVENDEESEILWRRMRHEREVLVNEQSQKKTSDEILSEDILLLDQNSQTVTSTNTSTLAKRKFQIIKTSSNSLNGGGTEKKDSPFLIKNNKNKSNRSFLSRDEQTLNKIASFISNKVDDEVTNLSSHGGNSMSFVSVEKATEENKRKSDENCKNHSNKRRRIESQNFLLDQLNKN